MIGGAVTGAGGTKLGGHLASHAMNEEVHAGQSRGLMAEGIEEQVAELTSLAKVSKQKSPLRHVYASPPPESRWDEDQWARYWETYETAMGLEGCAFSEAIHLKTGAHDRPEHRHRVYLALTERGTLVRNGHDYAKQEAVSRIAEFDTRAVLTKGAHNVRAMRVAQELGREDVANAMVEAGLLEGTRARSGFTPQDRAKQERTHIGKQDVAQSVLSAWKASDDGQSFAHALQANGLTLAQGAKCPIVVDATGNSHSLTRMLNMATKAERSDRIPEAVVSDRLADMPLPPVATVQAVVTVREPTEIPPTARIPPMEPVGELRETSRPTEAPAGVSRGGSVGNPAGSQGGHVAETAPPAGAFADNEVIEGPGEPPGPSATPEEVARYRKKLAEYDEKKAQAWERARKALAVKPNTSTPTTGGGGSHGGPTKDQQDAIKQASARLVASLLGKSEDDYTRHEQPRVGITGPDARGESANHPDRERPQGLERGHVVSNSSGSKLREPSRTLDPVGADRKGSQHQSDDFGSVDGAGGGHHAHRGEANHARVQDRRFTRTISNTLTAQQSERFAEIIAKLHEAPTAGSLTREQIQAHRADIDRRLSGKPWSKHGETSAELLAEIIQKTAKNAMAERQRELEAMRHKARQVRQSIPWWSSLTGLKSKETHKAEALEKEADTHEARIKVLDHRDRLAVQNATLTATSIVAGRLAEVRAWEARPDIAKALDDERMLFKVSASVSFGDERITALLLDGRLDLALAEERKREQAEQRQLEREKRQAVSETVMSDAPPITLKGYR